MNNNKRRTAWRATAKALEIIFTMHAQADETDLAT